MAAAGLLLLLQLNYTPRPSLALDSGSSKVTVLLSLSLDLIIRGHKTVFMHD